MIRDSFIAAPPVSAADTLPSWYEGPARKAILGFVARVTKKSGPDYVPPGEGMAVFDNDGTLWSEQPMYVRPGGGTETGLDRREHEEWKRVFQFLPLAEGRGYSVK